MQCEVIVMHYKCIIKHHSKMSNDPSGKNKNRYIKEIIKIKIVWKAVEMQIVFSLDILRQYSITFTGINRKSIDAALNLNVE